VTTITGNGFFEWGLVDGPAHKAMLQRPSDLAVLDDGSIIVVDTGNDRLRRLANRRIRTLGLAGLSRPAGVCTLPGGRLLVADTGNNRLVVVDTDLQTAWPLALQGVLPPRDLAELAAP
jgi:glucose/arabinose dehydrogenase